MNLKNKSGFTLLEVIIVIIIVGVLASLALPRFFSTVEYSRGTEAMSALATVRQSIERCYLMRRDYGSCTSFATLDVENPEAVPNAHFMYVIASGVATEYTITATRASTEGGSGGTIQVYFNGTSVLRSGTGPFGAIQ